MRNDDLQHVQLPHLETFAKAAELRSFTDAAKALSVSQASVSQRIRALEGVLRTSLFRRRQRGIALTDEGQRLYSFAERILRLHREAFADLSGRKDPRASGELTLAASSVPGEHILPAILTRFRREYPGIRVRANVVDSATVLDQLQRGDVTLGLVGRKSDNPHLAFRPFAKDELVLIVAAKHRWFRRKRVSLRDLRAQPLVLRGPGSGSRWFFEQSLGACGTTLADLNIVLELGSNEAIKEAVADGGAAAVLSDLAVRQELADGRLHALRIAGLPLERAMYVVTDPRRALAAPAQVFLRFLDRPGGGP
ncbi:MAG TPA: LysR substrate-binding domain-containing protein [Pirellulales bacterium]|nr:LysR substrate-binding domain-containing protein [Pirellulales bacterium]